MEQSNFFVSRNQIIKNLEISEETWDQFCLLNGIIPFCPREKSKKKLQTFYIKSSARAFFNHPFLIKIKEIESWKKFLRLSIQKNFKKLPKKFSDFSPFYDFENLIIKKFPKFLKVLKQLEEIVPFIFLITDNFLSENSISEKLNDNLSLILEFFNIFLCFASINSIFEMKKAFGVEFKLMGVNIKFVLTKKNLFFQKKTTSKKIFSSFLEMNVSLFKFIINKFEKIKKFKNFNSLKQKDSNSCLFLFSKRNFILKQKREKNKKFFSEKIFEIYSYMFQKKKSKAKIFRIFSKNFNIPSKKNLFGGIVIFFYQTESQFYLNAILNLHGVIFTNLKNDKNTLFFAGERKMLNKSLITIYFNFYWIFYCVNTKTYLPMKMLTLKKNLPKLNPFFKKFNGIKKSSPIVFRNKFKIQKITENEKKSMKKKIIFFLRKINDSSPSFHYSSKKKKIFFQCIGKSCI